MFSEVEREKGGNGLFLMDVDQCGNEVRRKQNSKVGNTAGACDVCWFLLAGMTEEDGGSSLVMLTSFQVISCIDLSSWRAQSKRWTDRVLCHQRVKGGTSGNEILFKSTLTERREERRCKGKEQLHENIWSKRREGCGRTKWLIFSRTKAERRYVVRSLANDL